MKWSKMARLCFKRMEHDIKNRFFSIISKYVSLPIRKMKHSLDYMNCGLLETIIEEMHSALENKNSLN